MIKTPQKASLWWLFTSDGTRRKMWLSEIRGGKNTISKTQLSKKSRLSNIWQKKSG